MYFHYAIFLRSIIRDNYINYGIKLPNHHCNLISTKCSLHLTLDFKSQARLLTKLNFTRFVHSVK